MQTSYTATELLIAREPLRYRHPSGRPVHGSLGPRWCHERHTLALGLLILRAQQRDGIPAAEFPPHTCADHPRPLCNRTICNVCGVTIG